MTGSPGSRCCGISGRCFRIHPLALENILATDQRPKAEDYGSYLYVVLKMLRLDDATGEFRRKRWI